MATKRKTTTAIVAGVTAAALLLGGTFAWTSISQQAKNEAAGIVNVGGRLHDDFNGTNKDVYVENFTDPLNGGQPIYARVKLTEYMEVGKDAGGNDVDNDGTIDAAPVINGTERDKTETWKPHIPNGTCAICDSGDTCLIHDHWTWTMGGDNGTTGQTTFMPTFNKDKDSLAADINGTYHGTDETDKIYYDDYVVYTTDNTTGGVGVAEADKEAYDGSIYSVIGTEVYDDDTDTEDNGGTRQEADKTHTAKQTSEAKVMTMAEWEAAGSQPGNYWVYDEDGWAYWANPIMPGEATGLLLDSIVMEKNPGEKCYYAINVVGQFATVGDWEYFTDGGAPSEKAQELLDTVSKNVATVTVTNVSGTATVDPGATVNFSASVAVGAASTYAAGDFEWAVYDENLKLSTTSQIKENDDGTATLTVGNDEQSKSLIVTARATSEDYLGATGMASIAVNVPEVEYAIELSRVDEAGELIAYPGYLKESDTWQVSLTKNGVALENVTWSEIELVDNGNEYEHNSTLNSGTKLNADGTLTIDSSELHHEHYSGGYAVYTYHVIRITGTADGQTVTTDLLMCNEGFSMTGLAFYDPETGEKENSSSLIANEPYDVRIVVTDKASGADVTAYHDPVLPGDIVFNITKDGVAASDAKLENNQFTATATGTYKISGSDADRGITISNASVTVDPTLINQIAVAQAVGSTVAGGNNVYLPATDGEYVTINGNAYYVVAKDETDGAERALLLGRDLLNSFDNDEIFYVKFNEDGVTNLWSESVPYNYLNTTDKTFTCTSCDVYSGETIEYTVTSFLTKNPKVASLAMPTEINGTTSKVFLLSEADLYGTTGGVTAKAEDYTYIKDGAGIRLFEQSIVSNETYGDHYKYNNTWLRSAYGDSTVAYLTSTGVIENNPNGTENYNWGRIAPAFWVDISGADVYNQ